MNAAPDHRRVRTNGTEIAVSTAGRGLPVMLTHGAFQTGHAWRHVVPLLARDHLVIVPDLRGHGESAALSRHPPHGASPRSGHDAANLALDLVGVLDALGLDAAAIVAHDMSVPAALVLSALHPERVLGVACLDHHHYPGDGPPPPPRAVGGRPGRGSGFDWLTFFAFGASPGLAERVLPGIERRMIALILGRLASGRAVNGPADIVAHASGLCRSGGISGACGWHRDWGHSAAQIRELAADGAFTRPVVAFGGAAGHPLTRESLAVALCRPVGGAVVRGAAHLLPEEQPRRVVTHLRPFLDRIAPIAATARVTARPAGRVRHAEGRAVA